jgi:hypothetical protein
VPYPIANVVRLHSVLWRSCDRSGFGCKLEEDPDKTVARRWSR